MFSGVFIAEEVDGVGHRWLGYTTVEAVMNMSLKSGRFTDEAFFW
jgi:hypothetical protein